jgi:hypothetical protein
LSPTRTLVYHTHLQTPGPRDGLRLASAAATAGAQA